MRKKIKWGRLFRRSAALFLATMGLWLLLIGAGAGAASGAAEALGGSGDLVSAALRTELGPARADPLSFWGRLAVDQSPLLVANPGRETEPAPSVEPLPNAQPAPDHDDITEAPETTTAPGDIVERTLVPTTTEGYVTGAGLYLYNRTDLPVDLLGVLKQSLSFTLAPAPDGPQILIIHTHATEAYTQDGTDIYTPSDNNTRTLDEAHNMIRVGDEMERVFTEMGLSVLHDRSVYDYPQYNGSYGGAELSGPVPHHPPGAGCSQGRPGGKRRYGVQSGDHRGRGQNSPGHAGGGQQRGRGRAPQLDAKSGPGRPAAKEPGHPLPHPGPAHDPAAVSLQPEPLPRLSSGGGGQSRQYPSGGAGRGPALCPGGRVRVPLPGGGVTASPAKIPAALLAGAAGIFLSYRLR